MERWLEHLRGDDPFNLQTNAPFPVIFEFWRRNFTLESKYFHATFINANLTEEQKDELATIPLLYAKEQEMDISFDDDLFQKHVPFRFLIDPKSAFRRRLEEFSIHPFLNEIKALTGIPYDSSAFTEERTVVESQIDYKAFLFHNFEKQLQTIVMELARSGLEFLRPISDDDDNEDENFLSIENLRVWVFIFSVHQYRRNSPKLKYLFARFIVQLYLEARTILSKADYNQMFRNIMQDVNRFASANFQNRDFPSYLVDEFRKRIGKEASDWAWEFSCHALSGLVSENEEKLEQENLDDEKFSRDPCKAAIVVERIQKGYPVRWGHLLYALEHENKNRQVLLDFINADRLEMDDRAYFKECTREDVQLVLAKRILEGRNIIRDDFNGKFPVMSWHRKPLELLAGRREIGDVHPKFLRFDFYGKKWHGASVASRLCELPDAFLVERWLFDEITMLEDLKTCWKPDSLLSIVNEVLCCQWKLREHRVEEIY